MCEDRSIWEICVPFPQFCSKKLEQKSKKNPHICTMVLELSGYPVHKGVYLSCTWVWWWQCKNEIQASKYLLLCFILTLSWVRNKQFKDHTLSSIKRMFKLRLKRGIRMCKYERVCGLLRNRKIQYG